MAEQSKMLFGVNTPGGPGNIVLEGGSDRGRGQGRMAYFWILGTPCSSGKAEARDLKLMCM